MVKIKFVYKEREKDERISSLRGIAESLHSIP